MLNVRDGTKTYPETIAGEDFDTSPTKYLRYTAGYQFLELAVHSASYLGSRHQDLHPCVENMEVTLSPLTPVRFFPKLISW